MVKLLAGREEGVTLWLVSTCKRTGIVSPGRGYARVAL